MIKLGTNSIGKVYLGSTEIVKAYLGSDLVFSSGPPGPYDGFTNGKYFDTNGNIANNADYAISPYIEIPSGSIYLTFDLCEATSVTKIKLYDANKTAIDYYGANTRYRTIKINTYESTVAFVQFAIKIELRGAEFLRVRDGSFGQLNIWAGPDYYSEYDKVYFGCSQGKNSNPPAESLTYATTERFYIEDGTTSVQFGSSANNTGNLYIFDSSQTYIDWYGQNANPRTLTNNNFKTTWKYVSRGFPVASLPSIFIKNVTTNTYLFKGKNVV